MKPYDKKIVLENGLEFYGYGFGADREAVNEIVFNTSMVGYQEILSDPSYTGSDGGDDLSADRQLRYGRGGLRNQVPDHRRHDRARVQRHAQQLPLYQDAGRGVRGARHPGHFGHRHAPAGAHHPQRGQPAGHHHRRRDADRGGARPSARANCRTTWWRG